MKRCRAHELGLLVGHLPRGRNNSITDVPGVRVGHTTLIRGEGPLVPGQGPVRTGVTAIVPGPDNPYACKLPAAFHTVSGYGKPAGIAQVMELGTLETPILLTNTLSVPTAANALITWSLERNPEIGITQGTVNPVVFECNDGYLNDIRGRHVTEADCLAALRTACDTVVEGAVGAGTGMSAFGFKGGIGTASRLLEMGGSAFHIGVLVLSNFGRRSDLRIAGVLIGPEMDAHPEAEPGGSAIVILATDVPAGSHDLGRIARRSAVGLFRTGSYAAHSSGEFVFAFSTTAGEHPGFSDDEYNLMFQAAAEATEEAVMNSMFMADTMVGRDHHVREGIPLDKVVEVVNRGRRGKR